MTEMQNRYAQTFCTFFPIKSQAILIELLVRGDSKKAMNRLRGGIHTKTHHFSTFRSGILIGAAIPAFSSGIYYSASFVSSLSDL